jgi:hypothetical protein
MIVISGIAAGGGSGEVAHAALSKGQQIGGKMSILNEVVLFFALKFPNN